jgi:patatin-like phospholipase/acyl hydrolase
MTEDRFQILALDGGGSRGLFTAALLAAVEEDLHVSISDHFDLIAGTSTGGIIAIALGLGLRPRQIVDFYVKHSPVVFSNPLWLRSVQQWFFRKYSHNALEAALKETFQDRLFGDSAKRLVIPCYELGSDDVYIFRTAHAERLKRDFKVPAWKVGPSTSAAPTYFQALRGVDQLRLVDGGMWANNPAMVALVESFGTFKDSTGPHAPPEHRHLREHLEPASLPES